MLFGSAWIVGRWGRVVGWAESLIQGWLKLHYFSGGVLAEAISMTHFSMLCKLDIISMHFIFMSRCCFRFSSVRPLFQILYSMKSVFFIKTHVKVFYNQIWKNYWNICCTHMRSHAIWVGEIMEVMIKKINKS